MHSRKAPRGEERYNFVSHTLCGESIIDHGSTRKKAERDAENKLKGHQHGCRECKSAKK